MELLHGMCIHRSTQNNNEKHRTGLLGALTRSSHLQNVVGLMLLQRL